MNTLSTIGIPIYTLAKYRGMGQAAAALREQGIIDAISTGGSVVDYGIIELPELTRDSGPETFRNGDHFLKCSRLIASAASLVASRDLLLCLGGECSLVPGELAGLQQVFEGNVGIVWFDAHGDFNTPETTCSGFIGGMPLALACGRGPAIGLGNYPLVKEENVIHIGGRDLDPREREAMSHSTMTIYSAIELRKKGRDHVANEMRSNLEKTGGWVIAHIDLEVLEPSLMPAVNYPANDGLSFDELACLFSAVKTCGRLKVVNVTAYNPEHDKDGSICQKAIQLVARLLASE